MAEFTVTARSGLREVCRGIVVPPEGLTLVADSPLDMDRLRELDADPRFRVEAASPAAAAEQPDPPAAAAEQPDPPAAAAEQPDPPAAKAPKRRQRR